MNAPALPNARSFFASRHGVCIYISVDRASVRICFESLQADGQVELDEHAPPERVVRKALAIASEAFLVHRDELRPLFEAIATASQVPDRHPLAAARH